MITTALAIELRDAGLRWEPSSGDAFQLAGADFEGDVFTVSDMTIEPHRYASGTVLGFNGTTEWALDSVSIDEALWLPREDQLRELLRSAFLTLSRRTTPDLTTLYAVTTRVGSAADGTEHVAEADDAAQAYGLALLNLMRAAR